MENVNKKASFPVLTMAFSCFSNSRKCYIATFAMRFQNKVFSIDIAERMDT